MRSNKGSVFPVMGQPQFFRDTWVEINLDHIYENVRSIRSYVSEGTEIIAVVKANGYGHGDFQVAKVALEAGATMVAVSLLDEALSLRRQGIQAPILMLGASRPEDAHIAAENDIVLSVFQKEWLKKAQCYMNESDRLRLQIKIDSGMGRIGVRDGEELKKVEEIIKKDERFILEGIFTHFSTADERDLTYFHQQVERFHKLLNELQEKPRYIHCGNSAAALRFPNTHMNAVRIGISMYGLAPSPVTASELVMPLKEAFTLRTKLIHVKKIQAGEKVSYGAVYEATADEWIGTLPIGYADGWLRRLTGQEVLVNGVRAPIVGKICMDQCMIKLPSYFPVGTVVTLIGTQNGMNITVDEVAEKLETINYEVPCIISSRVPRVYERKGKIMETKNPVLL